VSRLTILTQKTPAADTVSYMHHRYCFKAGRKTIPPWFAIATSGYGTYASTRTNWDKVRDNFDIAFEYMPNYLFFSFKLISRLKI